MGENGLHGNPQWDADNDVPAFEQPDQERVYRNYLETCRRLGVKPTPQGRAEALIKEWTKALAAGRIDPPEAQ